MDSLSSTLESSTDPAETARRAQSVTSLSRMLSLSPASSLLASTATSVIQQLFQAPALLVLRQSALNSRVPPLATSLRRHPLAPATPASILNLRSPRAKREIPERKHLGNPVSGVMYILSTHMLCMQIFSSFIECVLLLLVSVFKYSSADETVNYCVFLRSY